MTRLGGVLGTAVVLVTAVAMFVGGVLFTRGGPVQPAVPDGSTTPASAVAAAGAADLGSTITALQERLRGLPEDHAAWAALGTAYVQQASITGDPSFYPKAEGALQTSLEVGPAENAAALTGLASLAAARHDFTAARDLAVRADRINSFGAANLGILSDALLQLGRYGPSFTALQRMLDLQPGVPSFTRASYAWELRGRLHPARAALEQALALASRPSDIAYCRLYLGELAWNAGELGQARAHYAAGLAADPAYVPLVAGQAKVAAARGNVALALSRYRQVVQRLPVPTYLIAYSDFLRSLGRDRQAARQDGLVEATQALFEAAGASVDLEIAVFDAERGRTDEALSLARTTWQAQPSIEAADAYAWVLHLAGRDRTAWRFAHKAARLGTVSAPLAYHRGMIEKSLGREAAARSSLRRALEVNPSFSPLHAPQARTALESLSGG